MPDVNISVLAQVSHISLQRYKKETTNPYPNEPFQGRTVPHSLPSIKICTKNRLPTKS